MNSSPMNTMNKIYGHDEYICMNIKRNTHEDDK